MRTAAAMFALLMGFGSVFGVGFLGGWELAKHQYGCRQVGSGVSDVFRTDRAVYRVCR